MRYNKLVRDKIPEIIQADNKTPIIRIADGPEYWERLKDKLLEEAHEFTEDETEKELADILEVINAICEHKNIDKDNLEQLRQERAEKRGAFSKRIILEETKKKD
ncbi:hypothetical protein ACFL3V_05860 [Nanoarchaeota archaeon]